MEHLIANSGLQFICQELDLNPAESPTVENDRSLMYHFLRKVETDEISGIDEVVFDFLCESGTSLVPLRQLMDPEFGGDNLLELMPTGRYLISQSGLPVVKSGASLALFSVFPMSGNPDVVHVPSLDYLTVPVSSSSFEMTPAFDLLLEKWLPVPMFEEESDGYSRSFPTGWCRVKLVEEGVPTSTGRRHFRVIWAFDTDLGDMLQDERPTFDLVGPNAKNFSLCNFAGHIVKYFFTDSGFTHAAEYVIGMIDQAGLANMSKKMEYLAYYIYFINQLRLTCAPQVQLHYRPASSVEVDLVLDIGNSRTCGVVFEEGDFRQSKMLEIRDLSQPWKTYENSFDMRFAIRKADFGSDIRPDDESLFAWNSIVRVGEEASRLMYHARDNDGLEELTTNYSSPKRYLWDRKEYLGKWDFLVTEDDPLSIRAAAGSVFLKGLTPWFDKAGNLMETRRPGGNGSHFSRSSLMTFAFVEVLQQAYMYVNSIKYRFLRGRVDCPRRLRNIIITAPTAMPLSEQVTLRQCATDAFTVLKRIYPHWEDAHIIPAPEMIAPAPVEGLAMERSWCYDEATASQFVFLYAELHEKYNGEIDRFIKAKGHVRPEFVKRGYEKEVLTIASIDIGAGTTDMMICSYTQSDKGQGRIKPKPLFWDSFYLAGDDILKNIILNFIINGESQDDMVGSISGILFRRLMSMTDEEIGAMPISHKNAAFEHLFNDIVNSADAKERELHVRTFSSNVVANFFGVDASGMNFRDKTCRLDFNTQVSLPIARLFMDLLRLKRPARTYGFDDIFTTNRPSQYLLDHFKHHFGFDLNEVSWRFNPYEVSRIVKKTMSPLMRQLSILLDAYQIDILVLAGRPTSLDTITDLFITYYPVSPDRLVCLNQFHVGNWYPLATDKGYFVDQKSVVAVGAMVGHLASTVGFHGLRIDMEDFIKEMHSTANYIGLYNPDNFSVSKSVLTPSTSGAELTIDYFPSFLGCKQLDVSAYFARPLYAIYNHSGVSALRIRLMRNFRLNREELAVQLATDMKGVPVPETEIELLPQSIAEASAGTDQVKFWLDDGAFKFLDA